MGLLTLLARLGKFIMARRLRLPSDSLLARQELTGMRFKFGVGQDAKPNDMAIQVMIAPASNKDNYFAGYSEPRLI